MVQEATHSTVDTRAETVALLALLRAVPRSIKWGDVAGEVRFAGSAVTVLDRMRNGQGTLFPDPAIDEAVCRAESELSEWEANGLEMLTVLSDQYPIQLAGVFDCPPFLFVRGQVLPNDRGMSVVGSRHCSPTGEAMAREVAQVLFERDLTIIAGLAEGIDTAAHREALAIGARTVAVIGTGIRRYYPAVNRALQDEIAAKGLVISQFYPDQPPTQTTFPMRNGTMSGYGLATIIVEAGENSGSRIQARKAADHGRPVILSKRAANSTTWGAAMADRPWVHVVGSRQEIGEVVDQILDNSPTKFLQSLGLEPA